MTSVYQVTVPQLTLLFHEDRTIEVRADELKSRYGGVENLMKSLGTNPLSGIEGNHRDLTRRRNYFGKNEKPELILPTFWNSVYQTASDRIIFLLALSSVLLILFGCIYSPKTGWWPGVAIFIVMFIQITIQAIADFDKDRRFVELKVDADQTTSNVIRGRVGEMQTIDQWELVVGDIIELKAGDLIPADCIVINQTGFTVDESNTFLAHTVPIKKDVNKDPFLIANSFCLTGTCLAVVAAVGVNSTAERVPLTSEELANTPL